MYGIGQLLIYAFEPFVEMVAFGIQNKIKNIKYIEREETDGYDIF